MYKLLLTGEEIPICYGAEDSSEPGTPIEDPTNAHTVAIMDWTLHFIEYDEARGRYERLCEAIKTMEEQIGTRSLTTALKKDKDLLALRTTQLRVQEQRLITLTRPSYAHSPASHETGALP